MMQMLAAGGMPVLTDNIRQPDEDNPRGYFEFEPVKSLRTDASWMGNAEGKAVKIVHILLPSLPGAFQYQVIFMHRNLGSVIASQAKMLARHGRKTAAIPADRMAAVYRTQIADTERWVATRANVSMMIVDFEALISDPIRSARDVITFCSSGLDPTAMASCVEIDLHRNRPVPEL
jgi:Sulfotransferase family